MKTLKPCLLPLVIIFSLFLTSCGNSGDATEKTSQEKSIMQNAAQKQDTGGVWIGKKDLGDNAKIVNSAEIAKRNVDLSRIKKGIAAAQQGNYQEALADFDNAVNEDPENANFRYYRAETYLNLQQYDKAWEDIHTIERYDPNLKNFHSLKGRYHNAVKQYNDAYHEFRLAIEADPDDAVAWDAKGAACMNTMRLKEAMEAFDKALELEPEMASAYYNRGLLFANNGEFQKAVDDLSISINLKPGNPEAHINRGNAYFLMKNYAMAEENYQKASELDANNWLAYNGLGSVNKAYGNNMKAILFYTKAMEKNPAAKDPVYNRGLAKFANGDRSGACADWQAAKSMGVKQAQKWLDMYCK